MADRSARSAATVLALLVILGAAALAVGAGLTWWTQTHLDSLAGSVTITAKGSQTDALLIPVALLALAGFGAALATAGTLRRLVGAVLLVGAVWTAVLAVVALWQAPASLHTELTRPALSSAPPQSHAFGPLVAAFGGVLVGLAGVLVLAGFGARRALGARYDAPTGRRGAATPVPSTLDTDADPEAAARWWKALDAGQDPTARNGSDDDAVAGGVDPGVSDDLTRGV